MKDVLAGDNKAGQEEDEETMLTPEAERADGCIRDMVPSLWTQIRSAVEQERGSFATRVAGSFALDRETRRL